MKISVKRIPKARKFKFGVYVGESCITSHKTEDEALTAAIENDSFYKYWGGSVSVEVYNSEKVIVKI